MYSITKKTYRHPSDLTPYVELLTNVNCSKDELPKLFSSINSYVALLNDEFDLIGSNKKCVIEIEEITANSIEDSIASFNNRSARVIIDYNDRIAAINVQVKKANKAYCKPEGTNIRKKLLARGVTNIFNKIEVEVVNGTVVIRGVKNV